MDEFISSLAKEAPINKEAIGKKKVIEVEPLLYARSRLSTHNIIKRYYSTGGQYVFFSLFPKEGFHETVFKCSLYTKYLIQIRENEDDVELVKKLILSFDDKRERMKLINTTVSVYTPNIVDREVLKIAVESEFNVVLR